MHNVPHRITHILFHRILSHVQRTIRLEKHFFVPKDIENHVFMSKNRPFTLGNNPMVGATVAVAVAIEESAK